MIKVIECFVKEAAGLNVLVIGETIIDEFIDVSYEGQSMKSICPVYKLENKQNIQMGGATAIANHLQDFVKKVDVITNTNREIVKTRYVDVNDKKKHVEINKFDTEGFKEIKVNVNDYDVVIVADFGHEFCDKLIINDGFHLMCQTNSNNFGFNRISKWKNNRKKSACIDLREASLQVNKRIHDPSSIDIEEIYNYELNTDDLFVTSGREGAFYSDGKNTIKQHTFKSEVVDTIGAGDTFFAFACVASHLGYKEDVLLVPSIAASLSTTWLCNEKSVNKKNLLEHAAKFI
jgi:bifunctional ADP-heptose synthase (sugar kinase/adenylyltransferase)